VSEAQIREVTEAIGRASFPALLSVAGSRGKSDGRLGQELLHAVAGRVAAKPEVAGSGASADEIERALSAVFVHGASPKSALADPKLRAAVMSAALDELAKQTGVTLTPEQAQNALALLSTGRFFADLASALAAVVFAVRQLPIHVAHDVTRAPHHVVPLMVALGRDLAPTPFAVPPVLEDLLDDGKLDHPPAVLPHTLACLLGFATLGSTSRMVSDLIGPNNQSVRLAIVAYARAHRIPLEEADLDLLRTTVFDAQTPDLGPALATAVNRYLDQNGLPQLLGALRSARAHAEAAPPG
jgi:hypothetical protein